MAYFWYIQSTSLKMALEKGKKIDNKEKVLLEGIHRIILIQFILLENQASN